MTATLLSQEGQEALALAAAQADPGSLAAAAALRTRFSADLAASALHQEVLRRKAVTKLGERAREMLFTSDGLEQATRAEVAAWRARRLVELGVRQVADLGCGIAADAMAMASHGITVTAVDRDPATAALAAHNLGLVSADARALCADAADVLTDLPSDTVLFLDPARRTGSGRSWRLEDLSPSWEWVLEVIATRRAVVKLGPGIDREQLPPLPVVHVSHRGDAVETTLWAGFDGPASAAVLVGGQTHTLVGDPADPPLGALGDFVHELDPAVSRARLGLALAHDLVQLDQHAGYLSSDQPLQAPFATSFRVLAELPAHPRKLAQWVRAQGIGSLEIKKRGRGGLLDLDPAQLRRQLKPAGPGTATILLARVQGVIAALHVERVRCEG